MFHRFHDYGGHVFYPKRRPTPLRIAALVIGGLTLAVVVAFIFGFVVQALWNALLPGLFGAPTVTYWQAVGLILLARILVGIGGHHAPPHKHFPPPPDQAYRRWWREEGRQAFERYVERIDRGQAAQQTSSSGG